MAFARESWLSVKKLKKIVRCFADPYIFCKDLPEGHTIKVDDIRRIRPGMGLSPKYVDEILGKKIVKSVYKGKAVTEEDIN